MDLQFLTDKRNPKAKQLDSKPNLLPGWIYRGKGRMGDEELRQHYPLFTFFPSSCLPSAWLMVSYAEGVVESPPSFISALQQPLQM